MKTIETPLFITFEGGEGSGKTTQIQALQKELENRGIPVVATREPGGTPLGERIRDSLLNSEAKMSITPIAELMLFLASRVEHVERVIQPALKEGKVVLCDRFHDSSVAYQGGGRLLGMDKVDQICLLTCGEIKPDLTFFLDIAPEKGLKRLPHPPDRMEKEALIFHQRVRQAFLEIANSQPKRVRVIDASQTKEATFALILQEVNARLKIRAFP